MDNATTLQADYTAMLMTSQSQLQIAKNNFRDLGITIGSAVLPQLNQLLQYAIPVMQMLADKFMSLPLPCRCWSWGFPCWSSP